MNDFQRARQPDQVRIRREALLQAAAELFDEEGPSGAGLNAIAARAGFTKSNVYRYFESREHVLLELFLSEYGGLCGAIDRSLQEGPDGGVDFAAGAISSAFVAHPRCCRLITIFSSVLEQNVSEEIVETVKRQIMQRNARLAEVLRKQLPRASHEDAGWALGMTLALVAGMWPGAYPSPAAAAVLAKPEFANMLLQPERDLKRAVHALLSEIAAE